MKKCIWCLENENQVTFDKKAHTIPKSLGGQNFNKHVCDDCNKYFGDTTKINGYSIEEALKETFCISRQRFLGDSKTKRQIGEFRSKFFDIKERNGKKRVVLKKTFLFKSSFQIELCRNFKRGLVKMYLEEFDRQTEHSECVNPKYNYLRRFARFNELDIPIVYFERNVGIFIMKKNEAETPILMFGRMTYLIENENFIEIEFIGHVFGFPKTICTKAEFEDYIYKSLEIKKQYFNQAILIEKLTDIDFTLNILNK